MKKILITLLLFSLSSVSAYYNDPIKDFLDSVGPSTFTLGAVFIISFALIFFALKKTFKQEKATPGIIALAVALLMTYWANRSSLDLTYYLYSAGDISFTTILFVAGIIALAIWIVKEEKKKK